jgi:hypothetical protein
MGLNVLFLAAKPYPVEDCNGSEAAFVWKLARSPLSGSTWIRLWRRPALIGHMGSPYVAKLCEIAQQSLMLL